MSWIKLLENRKDRVKRLRRRARQKKIRRKQRVFNRKIDARKYYGVGVNEKKYNEILQDAFSIEKIIEGAGFQELLRTRWLQTSKEDLEDIQNQARLLLGPNQSQQNEITELLVDSWGKGTRRVLNNEGDNVAKQILGGGEEIIEDRLRNILAEQNTYYNNLRDEVSEKINEVIRRGRSTGESTSEITRRIREEAGNLTKHRASTISRTEVTKAHTEATKQVMRQAQIQRVIWLATLDRRTCQTCEDLNETVWDLEEAPTPVQDTHPNCRCTLIADQRND